VAARYLELGKQVGDQRYNGYAQSAIHPWWDAPTAPTEILKLRAKLKETDHRYAEAIADLRKLVEQEPRDAQAWLELSNIYRAQGNYAEALQAADAMREFAGEIPVLLCEAPIWAATGDAQDAYDSITQALPEAKKNWPSVVQWLVTLQADIARALGRDQQAEEHFLAGLANEPGDTYLLRAYADFLLDRDREQELLDLLRDHTSDNGVLLRAAIAARRVGEGKLAADWQSQLETRFEEIRLRGSQPHGRYEARCALQLQNDPRRALTLALANWQNQKEIRDTRNVLEAAIAAGDPAAAAPVVAFLKQHGTEDVLLQRLVDELERK
jgi:tetratricopeptide (TPR) repeat protein